MRRLRGFKVVHVFDIAQTDGPDLPDVRPQILAGDVDPSIWSRLAALVEAEGFRVERGFCQGANGFTDHTWKRVRVLDTLPPRQSVKTLAHELAHCRHHGPGVIGTRRDVERERLELEAESIALLVMHALGVDAGEYTFPYLARWSCGDVERIKATAAMAIGAARRIIHELTAADVAVAA